MTCRDCVHYCVCGATEKLTKDFYPCNLFKDKSRFVELPCRLGDKVWFVWRHQTVYTTISAMEYCVYEGEQKLWIVGEAGGFDGWLGDVAFLAREEAEKKLEEMKNDNV